MRVRVRVRKVRVRRVRVRKEGSGLPVRVPGSRFRSGQA